MDVLENRTFDEIQIGESASLTRTLMARDIDLFAILSGDLNPIHLDPAFDGGVVAHSMWGAALISGVLGTYLPGAGTRYVGQSVEFHHPVHVGDTLTATATVSAKFPVEGVIALECRGENQDGVLVFSGTARVLAPVRKVRRPRNELPEFHVHEHGTWHRRLVEAAGELPVLATAVVHPVDRVSLEGAVRAAEARLIEPILVGPRARIEAAAKEAGIDLGPYSLIDVPHSHAAAERAVGLVREGEARLLMKGSLHTDELMGEVVRRDTGLRTGRRLSHAFIMDVPTYPKPLVITDAAINIYPSLEDKVDIVRNAIDLMHALGVPEPRVAILSAVETVTPGIESTMHAAALCKMADRGQIRGAILDGPLAFDNAISKEAALTKGIRSPVSGEADILVVPDLEAGNMLAKQLEYLAEAASAGVVLGARVPIVLTSRADGVLARLASCAVAVMMDQAARR